jgi:hypothetical protein
MVCIEILNNRFSNMPALISLWVVIAVNFLGLSGLGFLLLLLLCLFIH